MLNCELFRYTKPFCISFCNSSKRVFRRKLNTTEVGTKASNKKTEYYKVKKCNVTCNHLQKEILLSRLCWFGVIRKQKLLWGPIKNKPFESLHFAKPGIA